VYIWLRKLQNKQKNIKNVALYVCVPHQMIVLAEYAHCKVLGAFFTFCKIPKIHLAQFFLFLPLLRMALIRLSSLE